MKRFILYIFTAFTLLSCGESKGQFRLKGEFEHLQQGEFYIYSPDGGTRGLDTIKVMGGGFDYVTDLETQAIYYLLYPNLSEQVIFGASGEVVTLKGDARNLKAVEVKGSKPNEDLTAFRLAHQGKSAAEIRKEAALFIEKNPESPVGVILFRDYFLSSGQATPEETEKYYNLLCKAQPERLQLLQWQSDVYRKGKQLKKGSTLPDFCLVGKDSVKVQASDYKDKNLLINFWASWETEGASLQYKLKRLLRDNPGKIEVVSISLDVNETSKKNVDRTDSVRWVSYSDYRGWNSPVAEQFGVSSIPYYILVGTDGRVIATGSSYDKEIYPEIKKIIDAK